MAMVTYAKAFEPSHPVLIWFEGGSAVTGQGSPAAGDRVGPDAAGCTGGAGAVHAPGP